MRPITVSCGPYAAANASRLVASATFVSGTPLTLVTGVVDTVPRRIVVTAGSEASARTLDVVGTDIYGTSRSETISIPATTPGGYGTVLDYLTITSLTPRGGGWSAAATVGTIASSSTGDPAVGSSAWVRLDDYGLGPVSFQVDATGTITYTVDQSNDDPNLVYPQTPVAITAMKWITPPDATSNGVAYNNGSNVSTMGSMSARPLWLRLTCTSYTGTGHATLTVSQAGGKWG